MLATTVNNVHSVHTSADDARFSRKKARIKRAFPSGKIPTNLEVVITLSFRSLCYPKHPK